MLMQARAVFRKEMLDAVRDPRSLLSALLYPLLGPVLVGVLLFVVASRGEMRLPIGGAENAPNLVTFIESRDVVVIDAPADPEESVRRGEHPVILEIPEGFEEDFRKGKPARVRIIYDESRTESHRSIIRVRRTLALYSQTIASLRLLSRGVNPELAQPIALEEVDLATPQKLAANIMNMLPIFLILAAFFGGMQVAIDSTAGERERGSLEALLVNPVPRVWLVVGKWMATVVFSAIGVLVTLLGSWIMLTSVPLEDLGLSVTLSSRELGATLAAVAPIVLLSSSAQMLIATFARNFKEAQTYLSALLFLPMLPGLILAMYPMETETWMMGVPILSQSKLLSDVLRGDGMSGARYAMATGITLGLGVLALWQTSRMFNREGIIFGK